MVGVNVRLVLPGLMITIPLVLLTFVMVRGSPFGLMSLVSGVMLVETKYSAEVVSLTAIGDRRS